MSGTATFLWLWAPLAASAGFAVLAPLVARRVRPAVATWLLSSGGLAVAAAAVALPLLVLLTAVGQWRPVAALGHWSAGLLRTGQPLGDDTAALAAAVVGVQFALLGVALWRHGRPLVAAWRAASAAPDALVVLPDDRPLAFALPGWPGRVVASRSLLRALSPAERRVVLAHEQAHLDGRHDLHLVAANLAAAANPLLVPLPTALRLATERWADERAVTAAGGNRALVAQTITRVAAACPARAPGRDPVPVPAMTGAHCARRIDTLVRSPRQRRLGLGMAAVCLSAVPVVAALGAAAQTDQLFQRAERAVTPAATAPAAVPATSAGSAPATVPSPPRGAR